MGASNRHWAYIGRGPGGSGDPIVSVTDFAGLGVLTGVPDGYTVTVTAQAGLSADTLVQRDEGSGTWLLLRTACSYATHSAAQRAATPGRWYSSGGVTVDTKGGAIVSETTYSRALMWRPDASPEKSAFFPVNVDWIASVGPPANGNSVAPAGWSVGGPTPTIVDGKLQLSAVASSGYVVNSLTYSDAGLTSAGNAYMAFLVQSTAFTSSTATGSVKLRITVNDGTDAYDFGRVAVTGSVTVQGSFYNNTNGSRYTAQTPNEANITSSEALVEVLKLGPTCMVRVNGGAWQSLAGATARNDAAKSFVILVDAFSNTPSVTSTATVRHVITARSA